MEELITLVHSWWGTLWQKVRILLLSSKKEGWKSISFLLLRYKKKSRTQATQICKGNRTIADLRYGSEDSISPSTLICVSIKG